MPPWQASKSSAAAVARSPFSGPRAPRPSARERKSQTMRPLRTAPRGLVPYLGGKTQLARRILDLIASRPHRCYAEPFAGAGGIILRRQVPAPVEAINDISGEIINLFRIVQRHPQALLAELRFSLHAREDFARLLKTPADALTDIERAARFWRLQSAVFRADPAGSSFISNPATARGKAPLSLRRHVVQCHRRLARVTIERLDFEAFIRRYDRPDTLFYLDPPYWGCEGDYGGGFSRADFIRLEACLKTIRGGFILSLNDTPEVRALFAWAQMEQVEVTYGSARPKRAQELIICSPTVSPAL